MTEQAVVLALALAADLALGDPPNALHPVAWLGRLIAVLEGRSPKSGPRRQLCYGAALVAVVAAAGGSICLLFLTVLQGWNQWAYVAGSALILKISFSLRGLIDAARAVQMPLLGGDVGGARLALQALVSRDTTTLDEDHVASAVVESVAENTVDSFVAPLFFFALFAVGGPLGPAAAVTYRAVNTCDAMIGYRGRYEYLGKAAARLDDLLNLLPARLAALLLVAAAPRNGGARGAWRAMWRDRGCTESPNAGWPMSAMAGAIGVRLEKIGYYSLGSGPWPEAKAIDRACRLATLASALFAVACLVALVVSEAR